MASPLVILPLKAFDRAKDRLDLDAEARSAVVRETASIVAGACHGAGLRIVVVTRDDAVASWATDRDAMVISESDSGLDAAAAAGVDFATDRGLPWLVVHGDLPLLTTADLAGLPAAVSDGTTVLAPSRDGGTKLFGSVHRLPLRYGPGSFVRHLAAAAHTPRLVVVRTGTAVELDTITDLRAAASLPGGAWLGRFLG